MKTKSRSVRKYKPAVKNKRGKLAGKKLVLEEKGRTIQQWLGALDRKEHVRIDHKLLNSAVSGIEGLKVLHHDKADLHPAISSGEYKKKRLAKKPDLSVRVSKVIHAPVNVLFTSWIRPGYRNKWLPGEKLKIKKATENRSATIAFNGKDPNLKVEFSRRSPDRSRLTVNQSGATSGSESIKFKDYWTKALNKLKLLLENTSVV